MSADRPTSPTPPRVALWSGLVLLAATAFVAWLTLETSALAWLDRPHPMLTPGPWWAEAASSIAFVTQPFVIVVAMLALVGWAWRANLRRLCAAALIAPAASWAAGTILKQWLQRPRPNSPFSDLSTSHGWSMPSNHVTVATAAALCCAIAITVARRGRPKQITVRIAGVAAVLAIALNRWLLGAHHPTDLIAGALLGGAVASLTMASCRVHVDPRWLGHSAADPQQRRCAVIMNPSKIEDPATFRRVISRELHARGWAEPLWLETQIDDPGHAMVTQALAADVELVMAAGGDGTVRAVASSLAHTGTPLALIPSGTANILARNLGIPTDLDAALRLALDETPRPIDLIRLSADGGETGTHIAVMGGIGIDGLIMAQTDARLKKTVKSAAYAVAIARNLGMKPRQARITIDDQVIHDGPATLMLVGNVGEVQAGLKLFPRARADDGRLDVLVTAPRHLGDWVAWGLGVIARRRHRVVLTSGCRLTIEVDEPLPYELDGDTVGEATRLDAEVEPGCLLVVRR